MSRDELIALVGRQAGQITAMAGQMAELSEANEVLAAKLARLEHLLSRNSKNSSSPPSRDGDPGKAPPLDKKHRGGGPTRSKGKQPGVPGSNLAWCWPPIGVQMVASLTVPMCGVWGVGRPRRRGADGAWSLGWRVGCQGGGGVWTPPSTKTDPKSGPAPPHKSWPP